MRGTIVQVCISKGGLPKLPVGEGWAGPLGIEGDVQNHTDIHGGPLKALLLVSNEDLSELRSQSFGLVEGSLGENLTVSGIDFRDLRSGQRLRAGDAILELTTMRRPCSQLDIYNNGEPGRIQQILTAAHAMGGFYAKVIQPGRISQGDNIVLLDMVA